jgi:acetate kinase
VATLSKRVLTINSGSSSIKFSVYGMPNESLDAAGSLSGIGAGSGSFRVKDGSGETPVDRSMRLPDHTQALEMLSGWLSKRAPPDAVGHRIVHGGTDYAAPAAVKPQLISALRRLVPLAPNHLPREIEAIEAIQRIYPAAAQVACFDTAFHRRMPAVAQLYALPESVRSKGVQRYGFHGLSYEFIAGELGTSGRTIVCHLGNGASMAAIRDGKSIETTMGFTPTGGLVMSTRSGDMDPEVVLYLIEELGLTPSAARDAITKNGGLVGISGAGDMQELHRKAKQDPKAALAIEAFCYQARKFVGALSAVLGGLDTLVFTAGIGENDPITRARICENLDFLGVRIDSNRNASNSPVISEAGAPVKVRVMRTNEELMIARHAYRVVTS